MKVEFSNRWGDRHFIADVTNLREANVAINTFLQDHGYISPYWRYCMEGNEVMIDIGSHTEFFYISVPIDFDLTAALCDCN